MPGFGAYQVSNLGRVRGVRNRPLLLQWRCGANNCLYRAVRMRDPLGRQKLIAVHRLMWLAFRGPVPHRQLLHHRDGNRDNNALGNLTALPPAQHMALHNIPRLAAAGRIAAAARRRAARAG